MGQDVIVVGGGVMGCAAALRLAEAGLRIRILEARALGSGATGVNAGTLSLQIKRVSLMAYAVRGAELWAGMGERLGLDLHFRQPGGLNLAFTEPEAELLKRNMRERQDVGLPIRFLSQIEVGKLEPALSDKVLLASHCPLDGYASSSVVGRAFARKFKALGVAVNEWDEVTGLDRQKGEWRVEARSGRYTAPLVLIAAGAWNRALLQKVDVDLPIGWRVNQMSVSERTTPLLNGIVGHVSGLMSLKQAPNGTVIIGGGWQGIGSPGEPGRPMAENLANNLRFAAHALPALRSLRIVRSWYGYDSVSPDVMPMAGAVPGQDGLFTICCVRGGFTIGPCLGALVADAILGREPDLPLFDPGRFVKQPAVARTG
ncbi:MAG: FAD-binding oxidoreductase [Chelatococcus sp.]|uniref:NAD(P)/FAD-dependent oxidoreductase n=1 Tax=Chelatococcus sp. TaxID=1953771 RepID=UPI0025C5FD7D|nr:FAD-binding oxidoreductase [Chelatococcus sp.]MBX3540869.1 FAD-binding oxidoreductase [Chelatococcus sp.]